MSIGLRISVLALNVWVMMLSLAIMSADAAVSQDQIVLEQFKKCQTLDYDQVPFYGAWKNDFYYKVAELVATQDVKGCEQLGDLKDYCLVQQIDYMISTGQVIEGFESRMFVASKTVKEVVDAAHNRDIEFCESKDIKKDIKSLCKAWISLDPSFCSSDDPQQEKRCLQPYYFRKALLNKDPQYCSKISREVGDPFKQLYCLAVISDNPKQTINKFYRANACYEAYASKLSLITGDVTICGKIPLRSSVNELLYLDCVEPFLEKEQRKEQQSDDPKQNEIERHAAR